MKKKLLLLVLSIALVIGAVPMMGFTCPEVKNLDAADLCLMDFLGAHEINEGIEFQRKPLYNESMEQDGWQYDFCLGEKNGYALMIYGSMPDAYEIQEIYFENQSPFDSCRGLPVYIAQRTYLDFYNQNFYELTTNRVIEYNFVIELAKKGFRYCGAEDFVNQQENIDYVSKGTEEYSIAYDLPNYMGRLGETTCANIAGAIVISYYDRFCANLIPNYNSYQRLGTKIKYKERDTVIDQLIQNLQNRMNVSGSYEGITFSDFQTGMEDYVEEHGYTYVSTNLFSLGQFSMSAYQNAVEAGKPVALFLSGFAFLSRVDEDSNRDVVYSLYSGTTHVVIGCGYKIVNYYNANERILRVQEYLKVASGLTDFRIGYLNISGYGNLDKAISIEIE